MKKKHEKSLPEGCTPESSTWNLSFIKKETWKMKHLEIVSKRLHTGIEYLEFPFQQKCWNKREHHEKSFPKGYTPESSTWNFPFTKIVLKWNTWTNRFQRLHAGIEYLESPFQQIVEKIIKNWKLFPKVARGTWDLENTSINKYNVSSGSKMNPKTSLN